MQKPITLTFISLLLITVVGCSHVKFPSVYKVAIQQGNIITQEMVDQLKPGMTERQVRYIMGTPLIQDTFNPNRWDYFYSTRPAKGETTQERISIFFKEGKLSHFSGDFIPSTALQPNT